jgi:hypothetical protein
VVLTITCFILKKTWYDRLPAPTPDPDPVPDLQGQPETGAATAAS